jgi:hypothetical protein
MGGFYGNRPAERLGSTANSESSGGQLVFENRTRADLRAEHTDERQRATHAHKGQSQHVRGNCNVGFDAQGDHDWNCDQRRSPSHDADHAREEEHSD